MQYLDMSIRGEAKIPKNSTEETVTPKIKLSDFELNCWE